MQQRKLPLSGAVLKNMAYLSMFIDHFFASLFEVYIWRNWSDGQDVSGLLLIQTAGRAVGRIAFILFAFLLVEGFVYTHDRRRYILRLSLLAVLSELPFDLNFYGVGVYPAHQNIFFTLTDGMLVLSAWEWARGRIGALRAKEGDAGDGARHGKVWLYRLAQFGALLLGCGVAYFLQFDYCHMGVLLIFVFYILRDLPVSVKILPVACVMYFGDFSVNWLYNIRLWDGYYTAGELLRFSMSEMWGLAAFVPIALYNGSKGRQLPKKFYYAFYPVHLLFLFGLTFLLFGVTMTAVVYG